MIEVTKLRKRYGPALALDGMTFAVRPGQVTGFVGPNGAGKSTTMRVILGLGCGRFRHRADRRQTIPSPAAPAHPGGGPAGRRRPATQPIAALAAAGAVVAAEAVVAAAGPDILAIQHLPPDRAVVALTAAGVPFSEVSAHRGSLEDAYLELTRNAVEFRAEAAS